MVGLVFPKKRIFAMLRSKVLQFGLKKIPNINLLESYTAWTVPPEQRPESKEDSFYEMSMEERKAYNESYSSNTIHCRDIERNDPALVKAVEELGDKANGKHAKLDVIEIPDGIDFEVEEYDGKEWVSEKHRTWY